MLIPDGALQDEVIDKFHHDYGHPGITKTVGLSRAVCDFKGLYRKVKHWVTSCVMCSQSKYGRTLTKAIATTKYECRYYRAWLVQIHVVLLKNLIGRSIGYYS